MPSKPTTTEELKKDLLDHPNRGKVNGADVCTIETSPLNCEIDGKTYNKLILIRGALGYSKSQLATDAMKNFLYIVKTLEASNVSIGSVEVSGTSLFRGQVPSHIYKQCVDYGKRNGLSVRQVCTAALTNFANDSDNNFLLEDFIKTKIDELNCSREEVTTAIYGFSKKISREERIKREVADKKMDI